MRFIYSTENPVEAHIITHMLEQHGVMAQVNENHSSHAGHFIGGSANAQISVIDDEAKRAYDLIKQWQKETGEQAEGEIIGYKESSPPSSYLFPPVRPSMIWWFAFIAGAALAYYFGK